MPSLRERYEKPAIIRHQMGALNGYARPRPTLPGGRIDGILAEELVAAHGSPLFVVSEGELRRRYREMQRAFSLRYPRATIAYSYKTNYLSAICATLHQEGAWAEVVSGYEYGIAEELGVPGPRIVFNGPLKRPDELERAIAAGSMINVDSYEEIAAIEAIGAKRDCPVPVGIRVNMLLNDPPWDRFGFNLESGQAMEAVRRVASSDHLRLRGLHTHVGTYVTDVNTYKTAATKIADFCSAIHRASDTVLEYLDFGGGYASHNRLHGQWLPVDHVVPTLDQYAEALTSGLLNATFPADRMPRLILEPGRALVDEAVHMLTSVVSSKRLSDGRRALVLDAGVNVLPTTYWYRHEFLAVRESEGVTEEVNLYGPMCMNIDCLQISAQLPPMRAGELIMVKNIGAYNFSQSMQFIQLRPAVVMVGDGGVEVIRRPETGGYVRLLENVPERLRSARPASATSQEGRKEGALS